ncbi:MAG: hypothetical protein AAGC67_11560 [Myxococcota bacterium]
MSARRFRIAARQALCLLVLVASWSGGAHAIEVAIHDLTVSGGAVVNGNLVVLPVGETVTIGIRVEDPTASAWSGAGLSYYGYDGGLLEFTSGEAVATIFSDGCIVLPTFAFCSDEMINYAGVGVSAAGNRILEEGVVFPAVPLVGTPRVRAFAAFRHLGSVVGKTGGPDDYGLDGVFGGGDAHARVTFEGLADGVTELTIGTGDDLGGILIDIDAFPVPGGATNARLLFAVPEPGTASATLLGALALLAASSRRESSQ